MFISMSVLVTVFLAVWFFYGIVPTMKKEISDHRDAKRVVKDSKEQSKKFHETYYLKGDVFQQWARKDGQPLSEKERATLYRDYD